MNRRLKKKLHNLAYFMLEEQAKKFISDKSNWFLNHIKE